MRKPIFSLPLLCASALIGLGCQSPDILAPDASEPLPVSVQTRLAISGEVIPKLRVTAASGALTVRVTRASLCGTAVRANIRREPGEIAVVSHLSSNAIAALCVRPELSTWVVDYTGTVASLAPGRYIVRLFEALGGSPPRFVGSTAITVSSSGG